MDAATDDVCHFEMTGQLLPVVFCGTAVFLGVDANSNADGTYLLCMNGD